MEVDISSEGEDESELKFINQFYRDILLEALDIKSNTSEPRGESSEGNNFDKLRALHILKSLKVKLLPFLRSTALFFHFLTGVVPPERLKEGMSQSTPCPDIEYNLLCEYLGLPSKLSSLIDVKLRNLINIWCHHPHIKPRIYTFSNLSSSFLSNFTASFELTPSSPLEQRNSKELPLIAQPHTVNQLINLPKDYSELINSVSDFICPNSEGDDARTPTICLVCGTILCSQSYCCQIEIDNGMVGACTYHAHTCGAGVGIFLRIRDCKILLLAGRSKGIGTF